MKTTFIYALCEPGTRRVRYIGKSDSVELRFAEHLRTSIKKKTHLGNWLRALGLQKPELVIIKEVPDDCWKAAERRFIELARGFGMNLVNGTDGGDGLYNPSAETREKIAASKRGKERPFEVRQALSKANLGKIHGPRSPETCARISISKTGPNHPNCGKSTPVWVKQKMSRSKLAHDCRNNISIDNW